MKPAMMEAPVRAVVVALDAMMADNARAMYGQHPMAASSSDKGGSGIDDGINGIIVVGGIVIRVIVVVDAADKDPAEMMPVNESMTGISGNACSDGRCGNARCADDAAANERVRHAATAEAVAAASTAPMTNLNRQSVGNRFRRRSARIDRR